MYDVVSETETMKTAQLVDSNDPPVWVSIDYSRPLGIGGKSDTTSAYYPLLDVDVDVVRLWSITRTPTEVSNDRDRPLDPFLNPGLIGLWRFTELSGSTVGIMVIVSDIVSYSVCLFFVL